MQEEDENEKEVKGDREVEEGREDEEHNCNVDILGAVMNEAVLEHLRKSGCTVQWL